MENKNTIMKQFTKLDKIPTLILVAISEARCVPNDGSACRFPLVVDGGYLSVSLNRYITQRVHKRYCCAVIGGRVFLQDCFRNWYVSDSENLVNHCDIFATLLIEGNNIDVTDVARLDSVYVVPADRRVAGQVLLDKLLISFSSSEEKLGDSKLSLRTDNLVDDIQVETSVPGEFVAGPYVDSADEIIDAQTPDDCTKSGLLSGRSSVLTLGGLSSHCKENNSFQELCGCTDGCVLLEKSVAASSDDSGDRDSRNLVVRMVTAKEAFFLTRSRFCVPLRPTALIPLFRCDKSELLTAVSLEVDDPKEGTWLSHYDGKLVLDKRVEDILPSRVRDVGFFPLSVSCGAGGVCLFDSCTSLKCTRCRSRDLPHSLECVKCGYEYSDSEHFISRPPVADQFLENLYDKCRNFISRMSLSVPDSDLGDSDARRPVNTGYGGSLDGRDDDDRYRRPYYSEDDDDYGYYDDEETTLVSQL